MLYRLFRKPFSLMRKISYWRNLQKLNASSFPNLLPTPGQPGLEESHEILRKIFSQNFLPFWYPDVLDKELGGYRLKCDIQGRWISYENKFLVPQTRTLWFFSRLYNSPYKDEKYLEAARYGYEFIYENFWDNDFGGFYWEIEASSKAVPKPKKQIYGQAFALYALSEYAAASNDQQAYNLVGELFSVLEHNAHDTIYGGYGDFFLRNWQKSDAEQRQYIGGDLGEKTYNTHLHLLEALTSYYRITQDPAVRKRLYELIIIQSNSVVRKTIGACTERYLEDWTPVYKRDFSAVNYGHDLENIMLLSDACKALKISDFIFLDLYRTLFSYSLRFGFDYRKGGFFRTGSLNIRAHNRVKVWWIQAEALLSALVMYDITGEEVYFNCFAQTLDWINRYQVDWNHGEWFAFVSKRIGPDGDKAAKWKTPYHNGKALLECMMLLESIGGVN